LAISAVTSLLVLAGVFGGFKRRDYPGRITMVSREDNFLHLVFDKPVRAGEVPFGHNRGYWIVGEAPTDLYAAVVNGDRIVFRWDRLGIPGLRWSLDRFEYRFRRGEETRCYSDESAVHFWGVIVGIILAPIVMGCVIAAILGLASGRREAEGT